MTLLQEVELMRRIPLFRNIEPSKLKLLAFTSERLTFAAGQNLFKQGDMGDAAYIIIDGEADVIVDTPNGPHVVATVGQHDFVGEIAILCDVPRTATVRARTSPPAPEAVESFLPTRAAPSRARCCPQHRRRP